MTAPWGAPYPDQPGRQGGGQPGVPPPAVELDRVRSRGRRALLLGVAAALATLPLAPLGLALGLFALVEAVRALRLADRWHTTSRAGLVAVCLAPVVVLVAGGLTAVQLVFSAEIDRYQECMAGANTRTSAAACEERFREDALRRLGLR